MLHRLRHHLLGVLRRVLGGVFRVRVGMPQRVLWVWLRVPQRLLGRLLGGMLRVREWMLWLLGVRERMFQ